MNIGIALSGGGYRAAAFHLGALARMARDDMLEDVKTISTVSGGSIITGIIFAKNGFTWPSSQRFLNTSVLECYRALTRGNLQRLVLSDLLKWPVRFFTSRAKLISKRLSSELGINIPLSGLPESPRWVINSACYESGADFIFERALMGDYKIGYVRKPDYQLSDAVAASAGFPVLVGPMVVRTDAYTWYAEKSEKYAKDPKPASSLPNKLHLWDGGVYDNLGLEQLIQYGDQPKYYKYRGSTDFVVVSNASGEFDIKEYSPGIDAIIRLITIAKYQIESLRSRDMLHRIQLHKHGGRYFDSDNNCEDILRAAGYSEQDTKQASQGYLSKQQTYQAARISTEIKNLSRPEFMLLFRQGFEVADATLHGFGQAEYKLLGFDEGHWETVLN